MAKKPHKSTDPRPYSDKSRGERIQRVLADAGVDSRRHCEELVEEGRVVVNGTVIRSLPAWVDPDTDRIEVDGQLVRKPRIRTDGKRGDLVYVMLNKPKNTVCTNRDPEGRRRAIDCVDHPSRPRLFVAGRLDADSTGLVLLTSDGDLANRLTHPKYGVHKTYEIVVKGRLDQDGVAELENGIYLADRRRRNARRTRPVRLSFLKRDRDRTHLIVELREGRNRQIRRMFATLDHPVKKLKRIQMGPLRMKGLPAGHWRPLTASELRSLRRAVATVPGSKKTQKKKRIGNKGSRHSGAESDS